MISQKKITWEEIEQKRSEGLVFMNHLLDENTRFYRENGRSRIFIEGLFAVAHEKTGIPNEKNLYLSGVRYEMNFDTKEISIQV